MDIERETVIQAAAGAVSVVVFTGLVVVVGVLTPDRALDPTGAMQMVGVMAVFVVFMAALGLGLGDDLTAD